MSHAIYHCLRACVISDLVKEGIPQISEQGVEDALEEATKQDPHARLYFSVLRPSAELLAQPEELRRLYKKTLSVIENEHPKENLYTELAISIGTKLASLL